MKKLIALLSLFLVLSVTNGLQADNGNNGNGNIGDEPIILVPTTPKPTNNPRLPDWIPCFISNDIISVCLPEDASWATVEIRSNDIILVHAMIDAYDDSLPLPQSSGFYTIVCCLDNGDEYTGSFSL